MNLLASAENSDSGMPVLCQHISECLLPSDLPFAFIYESHKTNA